MNKHAITKWWIGGVIAMIPAVILIPASVVALAAHLETLAPGSRSNMFADSYSRTMLALMIVGAVFVLASAITELVAWMRALANANQLADKRWSKALLWSGVVGIVTVPLLGLGILILGGAMLAYLVGGPDTMAVQPGQGPAGSAMPQVMTRRAIIAWSSWGLLPPCVGLIIALVVSHATDHGGLLQGHTWTALALLMACSVALFVGIIMEVVSWWGAVFNTHRLVDKTWFKRTVWCGIVGTIGMPLFGLGAFVLLGFGIAYRVSAPDGSAAPQPPTMPASPPTTLAAA